VAKHADWDRHRHSPSDHLDAADPKQSSRLLVLDAATEAMVCGHKVASLAELRQSGFDVPDGFVIPAGVSPSHAGIAAAFSRLVDGPVRSVIGTRGGFARRLVVREIDIDPARIPG
jgi:hypothetical protein